MIWMGRYRWAAAVVFVAGFAALGGGVSRPSAQRVPLPGEKQLAVLMPYYSGWYKNRDGSATLCFGYLNRGLDALEIPIGPNNGFSPVPEHRGQPTEFLPGRQENVVRIVVPASFVGNLTWTLASGGFKEQTTERGGLNPIYLLAEPPPDVNAGADQTIQLPAGLTLKGSLRTNDLPGDMVLAYEWRRVSGPGNVTFTPPAAMETTATFTVPGTYMLQLAAVGTRPNRQGSTTGVDNVRVVVRAP